MSRPNLGYSNYYWIRQDQKAAQKRNSELSNELTHKSTHDNMEGRRFEASVPVPEAASDDSGTEKDKDSWKNSHDSRQNHDSHVLVDGKTQDYCNNRDGIRQNHDGESGLSDATAESKDGARDSKPGTIQESFAFEVPVRNGEGKPEALPSAPRIDSWLPAPVPETDK